MITAIEHATAINIGVIIIAQKNLGIEVRRFSLMKALIDLHLDFSPNSVLSSFRLALDDERENLESSLGSLFSLSPISIKTSSRLAERILYSAIFNDSRLASTF